MPNRPKSGGVRFFESAEEMLDYVASANRAQHEVPTKPWQDEMAPGDCFVRCIEFQGHPLDIYGEVIEIQDPEDRALMAKNPHLRMCRCYSVACPEGELGSVWINSMTHPINRELFEEAQRLGWPTFEPVEA
jgi:hypothetical protein